jgi:hypothetical protein
MVSWPGSMVQVAIQVEANSYRKKLFKELRSKTKLFFIGDSY